MKKFLTLLIMPMLCVSCATVTARKDYDLRIYSDAANAKAVVNDSSYVLPARVKVVRSKEDLAIKLVTDSVTKNYTIKSSPSPRFVYGNLLFMQAAPVGYIVDFTSSKRFYYGYKVNLTTNDTVTTILPRLARGYINYFSRTYPTSKGDVYFSAALLHTSHFHLQPRNETATNNVGFFGIGAGLEYYYKSNKYLKLNAGYALGAEPFEYFGAHESTSAASFTLTNNYKVSRFSFGYGFNYGIYKWRLINSEYEFPPQQYPGQTQYEEDLRPPMTKNSHAFGITLNIHHEILKNLWAGIAYNPTFYNVFPASQYEYQHIMNFEIVWKFQLRKEKKWQILKKWQ